jgi:hypothetical protein
VQRVFWPLLLLISSALITYLMLIDYASVLVDTVAIFFVWLCRTMRRYSPPYRSPPRRGYGGRGRSPPPRRGYGGRKEQGSCSLLVRNIPISVRYITLACLSCLTFYNYDHDHIAVKEEANIFSPTNLLTSTFLTFEDRRIFEFLLKGLVLSVMFTFQRTIIVGKHC